MPYYRKRQGLDPEEFPESLQRFAGVIAAVKEVSR
jgi:hypothetical protein